MIRRGELIDWMKDNEWDREAVTTCLRKVVKVVTLPSVASYPDVDVSYDHLVSMFEGPIHKADSVEVLRALAKKFRGQREYLGKLADQFEKQAGEGLDLEAAIASCPPPENKPGRPSERTASAEQHTAQDDTGDEPDDLHANTEQQGTTGTGPASSGEFDVFLCHNSQDKSAVRQIAERLRERGIRPWLDEWELRPGVPWQRVLEEQISRIKAAAVFVGEQGIGPWQREELDAYLREFIRRDCPVIPVLLPGAPQELDLPIFLAGRIWVDFRTSEPDPLTRLAWGIGGGPPPSDPDELYDEEVGRDLLFPRLVEFSKVRDIVFAFGGAKSGLNTFCSQFEQYLDNEKGIRRYTKADLQKSIYEEIKSIRLEQIEHISGDYAKYEAQSHLNVKCLFTSLAYAACRELHNHFGSKIERVVHPNYLDNVAEFTSYYFGQMGAISATDEAATVNYFFSSMQQFAEATPVDEVVVFMPWLRLSSWFRDPADSTPGEIWTALQRYSVDLASSSTDARVYGRRDDAPAQSKYDKVCVIVFADRIPMGHEASTKMLMSRTIWPLPPLSPNEIAESLRRISPDLGASSDAVEAVLGATGGLPWFIRLLLTYVKHLHGEPGRAADARSLVANAIERAEQALRSSLDGLPLFLQEYITEYKAIVRARLAGSDNVVDLLVRHAWAGSEGRRKRGVRVDSGRVDDWLSTGLVWLNGDSSDLNAEDYVFRRFETVSFRPATRLSLALFESIQNSGS